MKNPFKNITEADKLRALKYANVGTGVFDPAAKIWKDLKGGLDFTLTDRADRRVILYI